MKEDYIARINRVIDHIEANLASMTIALATVG